MKDYKTVLQESVQKLSGHAHQLYSRYAHLGRELLSALYETPENRNPYYRNNRRNLHEDSDYGKFAIPSGAGYPELKAVGSYI